MTLDPKKWTTKTQEAIGGAGELAMSSGHPEVTPDHVMVKLLDQPETIVPAVLQQLGVAPGMLRNRADANLQTYCKTLRAFAKIFAMITCR
jgi:ATP-dependent Clp protease ATP-binding subunit ClpB